MERVEIKVRQAIEKYSQLIELYGHEKKFMHKLQSKHKEIEGRRKDARQLAGKEREQKLIEEKKKRNLEKMKQKEHIKANIYRRQVYRSPQPAIRVFKKKVQRTDNEQNFLKYLGPEFDLTDEAMAEESKKPVSQQSTKRSQSASQAPSRLEDNEEDEK